MYHLSSDLTGATSQVVQDKNSLSENYANPLRNTKKHNGNEAHFNFNSPRCIILIDTLSSNENNESKCATFNNYRNTQSNVTTMTYDELIMKIDRILSVVTSKQKNT